MNDTDFEIDDPDPPFLGLAALGRLLTRLSALPDGAARLKTSVVLARIQQNGRVPPVTP